MEKYCQYIICVAVVVVLALSIAILLKVDKQGCKCQGNVLAMLSNKQIQCDNKCREGGLNYADCMKRCAEGLI